MATGTDLVNPAKDVMQHVINSVNSRENTVNESKEGMLSDPPSIFISQEEYYEGVNNPTGAAESKHGLSIDSMVSADALNVVRDKLSLSFGNELSRAFYNREIRDEMEKAARKFLMENEQLKDHSKGLKEQAKDLVDEIVGLGPIDDVMNDNTIMEIMVNGDSEVYVEDHNGIRLTDIKFNDEEHVLSIARKMLNFSNATINEASPICDTRLSDVRLNIVIPPISRNGTTITIRKYPPINLSAEKMIQNGLLTDEMFKFSQLAIRGGANILVVGSTGSGKTTFIKRLCEEIPDHERTLTIEDTEELRLKVLYPKKHIVSLECRFTGNKDTTIDLGGLLKSSLRMYPYRIIVGEIRSQEALDLIEIFNTGHDGGLSSLHANSAKDAVTRIVQMILRNGLPLAPNIIGKMVSTAIDIIYFVEKLADGSRHITEVVELLGYENDEPIVNHLYKYEVADVEAKSDGKLKFIGKHSVGEDCTISTKLMKKMITRSVPRSELKKWTKNDFNLTAI
ncbi:CpaF family protein [Paenibacillus taichungensis]|uniref:CpaF family protein n=1 Tax=Paenibacillus taichungensis TaxID=484184 RepID=A0ABX2MLB7_9BACL|nr:ATPase, T2SS/T4P/T4SS family [Paenibacillus taichungensis]NUU54853.1 CpaF family protein [Paenibacillus taichungensis]